MLVLRYACWNQALKRQHLPHLMRRVNAAEELELCVEEEEEVEGEDCNAIQQSQATQSDALLTKEEMEK